MSGKYHYFNSVPLDFVSGINNKFNEFLPSSNNNTTYGEKNEDIYCVSNKLPS
jgi:hypothetical protein